MTKPFRAVVVAAVAATAVLGLGGCTGITTTTHTVTDDTTVEQRISAVRLEGDAGGVTVDGRPGTSGATVHRSIDSPNPPPPGPTHEVDGGTLVLHGCGQHCSVDYTVTVPPGLPVTGGTSSGAVELNDVGSVDVSTSSGGITLRDVAGPTTVHTTNGAVRGTGINGDDTRVRTSNGEIDLTLATPQNVQGETSNGEIGLTVPSGSYRVTTRTTNGDEQVDVPDDPSGTHRLDLTTSNGAISVRHG
ncbi:DUF4097 family beta strand repeat-containing protein [Pseudonocardia phyllosphaerae]|uniref:DUF4097 family beta strand repeat-containing protein n=1 Tax=Pseudonocardia phyllosphaerae TaxID=3390502 RepID=UPI00397B8844